MDYRKDFIRNLKVIPRHTIKFKMATTAQQPYKHKKLIILTDINLKFAVVGAECLQYFFLKLCFQLMESALFNFS